eukprot:2958348-Pyramimonas_sp.AAC.1
MGTPKHCTRGLATGYTGGSVPSGGAAAFRALVDAPNWPGVNPLNVHRQGSIGPVGISAERLAAEGRILTMIVTSAIMGGDRGMAPADPEQS